MEPEWPVPTAASVRASRRTTFVQTPDGQVIGGARPHHAAANDDYICRTLHQTSFLLARRQPT